MITRLRDGMASGSTGKVPRGERLRSALVRMAVVVAVQLVVLATATAAWSWPTCD